MVSTKPAARVRELPPRQDHGFFGPGSQTWRVWTGPTALMAFQRSIIVESFDPFLAAAVEEQNGVRHDGPGRFDRTIAYFLTVAVGDSRTVLEAAERLMKVHAVARGTEPLSGRPYSANAPESQLWIHVTGWQSNLLCYERFTGRRLTPDEDRRYWRECRTAAEFQTCDPADVPTSRDEVREYYAAIRPKLTMSPHAKELIHYFLRTPPSAGRKGLAIGSRLMSAAVISTIPRWMRELGDFDHSEALDRSVLPAARAAVRLGDRPAVKLATLRGMAPSAIPVMRQWLTEEPATPVVRTPDEARTLHATRS